LAGNGTDEVGSYWRGIAQMLTSFKLLFGKLEGKTEFGSENKIKTATNGLGCENVDWIYVDQNWSPVTYSCEKLLVQC
jgi:hypothetical protein